MPIYSFRKYVKNTAIAIFFFCITSFVFAQEKGASANNNQQDIGESEQTEVQKLARDYRRQGLHLQQVGNFGGAMSLYQKAIELDPAYAPAYNDLGVVYEGSGMDDLAEESYLKAVQVDPAYLSAYSNLALLYEAKRDLDKALYYWGKREELGLPGDPWTERARQRLQDIDLVIAGTPQEEAQRKEAIKLLNELSNKKSKIRKSDKELAKIYLEEAKQSYDKGELVTAHKQALDALQLDSSNEEIADFIDKVVTRTLSQ